MSIVAPEVAARPDPTPMPITAPAMPRPRTMRRGEAMALITT